MILNLQYNSTENNKPRLVRVGTALESQNTQRGTLNVNSFGFLKKVINQNEVEYSLDFPLAFVQHLRVNN